jgi:hypothetical protein
VGQVLAANDRRPVLPAIIVGATVVMRRKPATVACGDCLDGVRRLDEVERKPDKVNGRRWRVATTGAAFTSLYAEAKSRFSLEPEDFPDSLWWRERKRTEIRLDFTSAAVGDSATFTLLNMFMNAAPPAQLQEVLADYLAVYQG